MLYQQRLKNKALKLYILMCNNAAYNRFSTFAAIELNFTKLKKYAYTNTADSQ